MWWGACGGGVCVEGGGGGGIGGSRADRCNGYIMARSGVILNHSLACRTQYGTTGMSHVCPGTRKHWHLPPAAGIYFLMNVLLLLLLSEAITGFVLFLSLTVL